MANVPGRGAPPSRPDGRDHGVLRARGQAIQDNERELLSRLADREADCHRLRRIIATGTEQLKRAHYDADRWRRETLVRRPPPPGSAVPPPPAGEHLAPSAALVAAQAEIIRLTQRVAAAEAETVSAENRRAAIDKTNANTTRNFHTVSHQVYKLKIDLDAERRSHEFTQAILQPFVAAAAAPRESVTATLSAVSAQLLRPQLPRPAPVGYRPANPAFIPATSPEPTCAGLLAMLRTEPVAAPVPRPLTPAALPAVPPFTNFTPSPIPQRTPDQITSPTIGSTPSSRPASGAGSHTSSADP